MTVRKMKGKQERQIPWGERYHGDRETVKTRWKREGES